MSTHTSWETPSFIEMDMSAEIGAYQGEDDRTEQPDVPAFVEQAERA